MLEEAGRRLAIVGGRLLDGRGGPPVEESCVLIHAGHVVAAGARERVGVPDDATIVDATHRTVLPGLVDLHVHDQSPANLSGST